MPLSLIVNRVEPEVLQLAKSSIFNLQSAIVRGTHEHHANLRCPHHRRRGDGRGVALDLALRACASRSSRRADLTDGTSGRYHGLLHSGGRYAVRDPESARECIEENRILRRILPHAIEDTGGLFITTPDDDPTYADKWVAACRACGIETEEISIGQMLKAESALNPAATRAFRVPDASCDSFDVLTALGAAVQALGGTVLTYHEVVNLHVAGGRVIGATLRNRRTGEESRLDAAVTINAAGAWAGQIAAMAGCPVTVRPSKGTMVAMAYRFVNTIINRCHPPGDGDILVPVGTVAVIGTTSVNVANPDITSVETWEIERMLDEGEKMVPGFSQVARCGPGPGCARCTRKAAASGRRPSAPSQCWITRSGTASAAWSRLSAASSPPTG